MKNTRYIFSLFLILFALITIVGSSSYAILKGNSVSNKKQIITTGSLKVKLVEKFDNIEIGVNTQSDVEAIMHNEYYEFSVSNIGDIDCKYSVYLINDAPENYKGKILSTDYIRVGLEVNNKEIGPIGLDLSKNVIDTNVLKKGKTNNYKLRLWLDEKKKEEIKKMTDYKSFLKIKVVAEQNI